MNIEQIKNTKLNFIITTARTGSTLLSSMLNTHPNAIAINEEPFAYNLYPKYSKIKTWTSEIIQEYCYDFYLFSEGMLEIQFGTKRDLIHILEANKPNLTAEIAIKLTYLCFFPNKDKSEVTTIVDKQLRFHFCLEKVAGYYPESKFIILYRDPRDQALARFRMLKKQKIEDTYYGIANVWKYVYSRLNKSKDKTGKERFLEVKYEDLVSNPEPELKKICSFIGIPYNPIMLLHDEHIKNEFDLNKKKLRIEANDKLLLLHQSLTEKVNTNKVGYWKEGLKPEEANLIWSICGGFARKIGYKRDEYFIKQHLKLKHYFIWVDFIRIRALAILYHATPFHFKYIIKKLKYRKKFKITDYSSNEFYKTSYHNN